MENNQVKIGKSIKKDIKTSQINKDINNERKQDAKSKLKNINKEHT